ncbi:MAG: 50S ribosomal protein L24 [Methylomonas sp.]|nr:50S ribosomal protein L24 [Methylomonas sp.]PPD36673.1 MAG: 50S ribosomal protein L24 [Methylomonas sp.]PPD52259.1 MAG: 50S ribosomal protein L24 [Methylotenera sp.]
MQKLKQGDEVIVNTGKDKGKIGRISKFPDNAKVIVEGVNLVKKHQRGNPNTGVSGGIVEKEMPIHISNIAIFNPKTKKSDRVGFVVSDSGEKFRVFKSTKEVIKD